VSGRGKRLCTTCGRAPAAFPHAAYCFACWPGGAVRPPPCLSCGSRTEYFVNGLCHRCHRDGHPGVGSCRNCGAWGATRTLKWLCKGCHSWCRKYLNIATCIICRRDSHLDEAAVCRLCRKQGTHARGAHEHLDLVAANRGGQQLFLADLFGHRGRTQPAAVPRPRPAVLPIQLPPHRQLLLFELHRDLSHRGYRITGLADRADPALAAATDEIVRRRAAEHGWSADLAWGVRTGVRILLAFQSTPDSAITASDAAVLAGTELPMSRVLDVLTETGLLIEDRTPTIESWFSRQISDLPEEMSNELRRWFDIMLTGSPTAPRRRPRAQITARLYLGWALPALVSWAEQGRGSLREISSTDVRMILPPNGNPRSTRGQALRSIFTVLKGHKVLFTNPIAGIKTGYHQPRQPLPLNPALLRAGLDSPDPARAALIALVAFHGLRSAQLRGLTLTDTHDGRLHIDRRIILLAAPVRVRLTNYLDYRHRSWPNSANPHLFLTTRSANDTTPAGARWIKLKIDITGGTQALREDRVLDEAHATGGDLRRVCDMFGLSVTAAQRYTTTVDHPDLITKTGTP
jgi:integrase